MKIAYYIGSLNRGGAEMLTLDICRQQQSAPYEMILVYRNDGDLSEEFRQTGVTMYKLKPQRWHFLRYMFQMRSICQEERVDVVHAQTMMNGVVASFFLLNSGIRLVTTFHGFYYGLKSALSRHIAMWGSKISVFVSKHEMEWYASHSFVNWKQLQVIYNGVNFDRIDTAKPSAEFSKGERLRLVMVGNFVGGRSQGIITKSIKLLKDRGVTDYDFYFVGRQTDKEKWLYDQCVNYCKEHHLDNVHFLGGRSDVPAILKSMDGFVYSTNHDTFGIAVVEAMAAGLPVIVNDWEVMREVTDNGEWATLYRTNDVEDCADKIEQLLTALRTNREQVLSRCATIAQKVRTCYSIEKHINNLNNIYNNIF